MREEMIHDKRIQDNTYNTSQSSIRQYETIQDKTN